MLTIYGAPHSRAFRVVWLANEIGIPYRLVPVSFGVPDAECKKPWYLQLNPNGKLPAIDDDGFILWESAAINLYLAEKHKSKIHPSTMQGKGKLLQWAFFVANEVAPAVIAILRNRIILPLEHRDESLQTKRRRNFVGCSTLWKASSSRPRFLRVTSGASLIS